MMGQLFNLDSPLMRGLGKLADLILLNILTVLCSIPIITLGASSAALYDAVAALREDKGHLCQSFFHGFKSNFKQATAIWLILLLLGLLLTLTIFFYMQAEFTLSGLLLGIAMILALIWCMTVSWAFPLQAKFVNTVTGTLRNAVLCSLAYLPRSLAMAALNLLPLVVLLFATYWFFRLGLLWLLVWYALAAYLNLMLLKKPYAILMKTPKDEEASDENPET